jgi:hypothetical protein
LADDREPEPLALYDYWRSDRWKANRHAQDCIQFAAHVEFRTDNTGIAAEPVAPEFIVEDDHVIVAGLRVFGNEMPPENRFCSKEEVEEAGGYAAGLDLLGPIGRGDGEALSRPCVERVEDLALFLPVEVVAGRSAIGSPFWYDQTTTILSLST